MRQCVAVVSTVLVHGGNCTGAIWSRLTPLLDEPALAVDLPGRNDPKSHTGASFGTWAEAVVADMDAASIDRAVVIGHSMGGGTLAAIARLFPERVAGVIYLSAVVPPDGAPFLHGLTEGQQGHMRRSRAQGLTTLPRHVASESELSNPSRAFVRSVGSSEALAPFFEPVSLAGLANAPLGFVKLLRDRSLTPERQDLFIERLNAVRKCEVRTVDGGHSAMVSKPKETAAAIRSLYEAFGV